MHESLNMLIILAAMLIGARLAGHLSNRIGLPAVFGELLLGLILGPAVLKLVHPDGELELLAQVGAIVLMFLAGMETDTAELRRVGRSSLVDAVGGVLIPLGAGYLLGLAFGLTPLHALFLGTVLTATSVSISAQVLGELGRLRSREGSTIMGAAIIDDVLGVIVFSLALALAGQGSVWIALGKMAVFFPVAWYAGDHLMPRLLQWDARLGRRVPDADLLRLDRLGSAAGRAGDGATVLARHRRGGDCHQDRGLWGRGAGQRHRTRRGAA